ncbi:MAG: sulfatase [Pseudomonadota bacterium]|nr:sulfatase [Pseudomonadota bacterium]
MKAIFILFDSLNRHALSCYDPRAPRTPNFDRLAARSVVFDRHYVGSMPCLPARRDIQTGRLNFMHRGWGPLEPFDHSTAEILRDKGVYTHLVTDHYHYFEDGGTGFHGRYSSWEFIRGQEKDKWRPTLGHDSTPHRERFHESQHDFASDINSKLPYYVNRAHLEATDTFPLAQCFASAHEFVSRHHQDDNWLLHLECFDPHEPFFAPERFMAEAAKAVGGKIFDWPSYGRCDLDPALVSALRDNYYALVAACDHYLGTLLDLLDAEDMWRDTCVILSTDHGLLLGEKEFLGKNRPPFYNEVANIPLMIAAPGESGVAPRRSATLTQTIDLGPTLLDLFGQPRRPEMIGASLLPVLLQDDPARAERGCIFGQFGAAINFSDGRHVYFLYPREPFDEGLFQYTLMPMHMRTYFEAIEFEGARAVHDLAFTRGYPVWRLPVHREARANMIRRYPLLDPHTVLFDLASDPEQRSPIQNPQQEARVRHQIVRLLREHEAPPELYERYGLIEQALAA